MIALLAAILMLMFRVVSAKEKVVNYMEVKHYFHIKDTTLPYNQLITVRISTNISRRLP